MKSNEIKGDQTILSNVLFTNERVIMFEHFLSEMDFRDRAGVVCSVAKIEIP